MLQIASHKSLTVASLLGVVRVLRCFAQLIVQGFDRVRRIHDAAEHGRERKEGREALPGLLQGVQSVWMLVGPGVGGEVGQGLPDVSLLEAEVGLSPAVTCLRS